jgi:ABC-type transporter Mla subunit MlaD
MPRSLRWRKLVPGLLTLAAVSGLAFGILRYAQIGALRGDNYRLYAFTNEARGILKNSEVWLSGQRVGVVDDVEFRQVTTDTARRLRLTLRILTKHQALIRDDSYAQIRSGGSLLGAPVVYITGGTEAFPALEPESVVRSLEQADAENITSQVAQASREFPEIARSARRILEHFRALARELDDVGTDEPGVALRVVGRRAQRLTAIPDTGSVGMFLSDSVALAQRLRRLMARADSLGARLQATQSAFARHTSDSALTREIADLRNEVSIVRTLVIDSRGTAGRLLFDRAIPRQLEEVQLELGRLMEDLRRDPSRYIMH